MTNQLSGILTNVTGQSTSSKPDKTSKEWEAHLDVLNEENATWRRELAEAERAEQTQRVIIFKATQELQKLQQSMDHLRNALAHSRAKQRNAIHGFDHAQRWEERRAIESGTWKPPTNPMAFSPDGAMAAAFAAATPGVGSDTRRAVAAATPEAARVWAEEQAQIAANLEITKQQIARATAATTAAATAATKPNDAAATDGGSTNTEGNK